MIEDDEVSPDLPLWGLRGLKMCIERNNRGQSIDEEIMFSFADKKYSKIEKWQSSEVDIRDDAINSQAKKGVVSRKMKTSGF